MEVKQYLEWMSDMYESSLRLEMGDFTHSPERLKAMTGFSWDNIKVLRELMMSMKNSNTGNVIEAIVIFLCNLPAF